MKNIKTRMKLVTWVVITLSFFIFVGLFTQKVMAVNNGLGDHDLQLAEQVIEPAPPDSSTDLNLGVVPMSYGPPSVYEVSLINVDSETGEPIYDAQFGLFEEGVEGALGILQLDIDYIFDENLDKHVFGYSITANLESYSKNYYVKQVKGAQGYELSQAKYPVKVINAIVGSFGPDRIELGKIKSKPNGEEITAKNIYSLHIKMEGDKGVSNDPQASFGIFDNNDTLIATSVESWNRYWIMFASEAGKTYKLKQLTCGPGYKLDKSEREIKVSQKLPNMHNIIELPVQIFKIKSSLDANDTGSVNINIDVDSKVENPDASITVYGDEYIYTKDAKRGDNIMGKLPVGKYKVEIKDKTNNYINIFTRYDFEITPENLDPKINHTFYARKKDRGSILVMPLYNGSPYPGFTTKFRLRGTGDENSNIDIDATAIGGSYAMFIDLPFGPYTLEETEVMPPFVARRFEYITLEDDDDTVIENSETCDEGGYEPILQQPCPPKFYVEQASVSGDQEESETASFRVPQQEPPDDQANQDTVVRICEELRVSGKDLILEINNNIITLEFTKIGIASDKLNKSKKDLTVDDGIPIEGAKFMLQKLEPEISSAPVGPYESIKYKPVAGSGLEIVTNKKGIGKFKIKIPQFKADDKVLSKISIFRLKETYVSDNYIMEEKPIDIAIASYYKKSEDLVFEIWTRYTKADEYPCPPILDPNEGCSGGAGQVSEDIIIKYDPFKTCGDPGRKIGVSDLVIGNRPKETPPTTPPTGPSPTYPIYLPPEESTNPPPPSTTVTVESKPTKPSVPATGEHSSLGLVGLILSLAILLCVSRESFRS